MSSLHTIFSVSAALLSFGAVQVQALPHESTNRAAASSSYDFVIVGGGAGGLALAVRLSEVASQNVLVLEAGSFPDIVEPYSTPGASQQVLGTPLDWAFTTPAQESLGNRTITYHRGRGVGGSTLINGLTYGRGSSMFPSFQKSTSFIPQHVAPFQTFNKTAYSANGPITLSYPTYVYDSSIGFIKSLDAVNVSIVRDLNLGDNIGTKQEPLVLSAKQERVSAYDGYYKPVRGRPNLTVLSMSMVQKILLEKKGGRVIATGVVYTDFTSGSTLNVTASKEVILSAGVFQTPQLLMLSGIGPQQTLSDVGIEPNDVNENIGQHMQDHLYFSVIAKAKTGASGSQLYNNLGILQEAETQYSSNHSGPLTIPVGSTYGFRSLSTAELKSFGAYDLLADRTDQAHIEYLWENIYYPSEPSMTLPQYPPYLNESFISITAALLAPSPCGNVTLQSNTIQDAPVINVNYLESPIDQQFALFMFQSLCKVLAQHDLSKYTIGPNHGEVVPGADVTDDATITEYIKSTLLPVWHACGPCRMLPQSDGGVVDDRLRVYGVNNLRIVDASIFPVLPDNHIPGVVYMVAEKAADMTKQDCGLTA